MKFEINIPDERLTELVEGAIVRSVLNQDSREWVYGVRTGIDKAVKEYIYKNKETIIEKVVERASKEMVRKGLPKLLKEI